MISRRAGTKVWVVLACSLTVLGVLFAFTFRKEELSIPEISLKKNAQVTVKNEPDRRPAVRQRIDSTSVENSVQKEQTDNLTTLVLSGMISDESGKPLDQVRVTVNNAIVRRPDERNRQAAFTDSGGRYSLELRGALKSLWRLTAEHSDFAPLPGAVTAETTAPVWNGKMKPFATISGVVRTSKGEPIAGAKVWGMPTEFSSNFERMTKPCTEETVSDAQGKFVINKVPARTPVTVMALPSESGWSVGMSAVEGAPATDVEVVPEQGGVVGGIVLDETEKAVEGAHVVLVPRSDGGRLPLVQTSDSNGRFLFKGASRLSVLFACGRNRYNEDCTSMQLIMLKAGETTEGVVLRFPPPPPELTASVQVVDAQSGLPVDKCSVYVHWNDPTGKRRSRACTTDSDGRFECAGIKAAEYTVRILTPGILPNSRQKDQKTRSVQGGTLANDYTVHRTVPGQLPRGNLDTWSLRVDRVSMMKFELYDTKAAATVKDARLYLAEGAQGLRFESGENGMLNYSLPASLPDSRTLMFMAVRRTGTGNRDCSMGTLEIQAADVRKESDKVYRIEMSPPEFWGTGHLDCVDASYLKYGANRVYPVFRNPKLGENGRLYLNELAQSTDKPFTIPILPGYESGVSFSYLVPVLGGLGEDYVQTDAWLLPEQWVGRDVTFIFDPETRKLTPIVK